MATPLQTISGIDLGDVNSHAFPSPITAGSAIIVAWMGRQSQSVSVTDDVNAGAYSSPLGSYHSAGSDSDVQILVKENCAAGTTTLTFSPSFQFGGYVAFEVPGLATSSIVSGTPVEGEVLDNAAPYTPAISITTAAANDFVVFVACDRNNNAATCTGVAGDITNFVAPGIGFGVGYATIAAAGTISAGLTFDAADYWAMQAVAFKAAGGAPAALAGSASATATAAGTLTPNQSAAPIADISAGAWVPSTGGSLYAMLDEAAADDGDYITAPVANSVAEVRLASMNDPLASSSHTLRYRMMSPVSASIRITIMQGAVQIAQWTEATTPALTTYSHTLSGAEADAITDYNNLRVRLEAL